MLEPRGVFDLFVVGGRHMQVWFRFSKQHDILNSPAVMQRLHKRTVQGWRVFDLIRGGLAIFFNKIFFQGVVSCNIECSAIISVVNAVKALMQFPDGVEKVSYIGIFSRDGSRAHHHRCIIIIFRNTFKLGAFTFVDGFHIITPETDTEVTITIRCVSDRIFAIGNLIDKDELILVVFIRII